MSSYEGEVHDLSFNLWEGLRDAEAANGLLESFYTQSLGRLEYVDLITPELVGVAAWLVFILQIWMSS